LAEGRQEMASSSPSMGRCLGAAETEGVHFDLITPPGRFAATLPIEGREGRRRCTRHPHYLPFAPLIACQTRAGVAGISM
jgi:hypothetical protein